jgi:tetratricopeptide (TPR) repeat protein
LPGRPTFLCPEVAPSHYSSLNTAHDLGFDHDAFATTSKQDGTHVTQMKLTVDQALQQGVVAHKEGKLQDAERLYRAILQAQPNHPDANHNLGVLAVTIGKPLDAIPFFKLALDANSQIEQFWLSYIDALIKVERFDEVKHVLVEGERSGVSSEKLDALNERLQRGMPNDTNKTAKSQTPSEKREKLDEKKRNKKAQGASSSAEPSQDQINHLMGHYSAGRLVEAQALATLLTQQFPKHSVGWKGLGLVLKQTGRLGESLAPMKFAVKLSEQDAEAHSNLGVTLTELGRLNESEASLRQAIALRPNYAEAHYNLGNTLKELGRLEEAQASYTKAIALKPDYVEAHNNLGLTLKELGRLDEAEASYTHAIELEPHFTDALINKWQLLFDKKEFTTALTVLSLCNTQKSRARSLETLYALGRIDEIYKRIEMQAELDDGNLRVAALSSFISEREKKITAHKFCPNPLSLIYVSNLSSHLEDAGKFAKRLVKELSEVATIWEPDGNSTVKGFQTPRHINLFENPLEKMTQLKSIILKEIDAYYLKFQNESCSFIQKWPSKKNLYGWHVILKEQGFQDSHIHPSGWLSGVIYLKVVPPLKKDEGAIEFSLDSTRYCDLNSPRWLYQPSLGDIVFFPSSLHHKTIPFTTDTDRIIVSFDLKPQQVSSRDS